MSEFSFDNIALAEPVRRALTDQGYEKATPIQAGSIPPQLEGRDLIGCAQTGTGKTAAFALPILSHLSINPKKLKRGKTRVLVLTPTRELAVQVGKSFSTYGKHIRLRHSLVYGGVSQHPQTRNLAKGVDTLVATPGRLIDLMDQGHIDLSTVEFLVIDEVDRLLDMGFVEDVRQIVRALPKNRQTSLFTATMSKAVEKIAEEFVDNAVRISVAPEKPVVENIHQEVCFIKQENKLALIQGYLRGQKDLQGKHSTIVFCRTKFGTENLSKKLNQHGFYTDAIHGDKSQAARQKALDKFRSGKVSVLIATDVAARGLDIRSISLVINYDLPESVDSYIHRIGRTARAEAEGNAVSFCTRRDVGLLAQIEKHIGMSIEVDSDHPFHESSIADRSSHHSKRPQNSKPDQRRRPQKRRRPSAKKSPSEFKPKSDQKSFQKKKPKQFKPKRKFAPKKAGKRSGSFSTGA